MKQDNHRRYDDIKSGFLMSVVAGIITGLTFFTIQYLVVNVGFSIFVVIIIGITFIYIFLQNYFYGCWTERRKLDNE